MEDGGRENWVGVAGDSKRMATPSFDFALGRR